MHATWFTRHTNIAGSMKWLQARLHEGAGEKVTAQICPSQNCVIAVQSSQAQVMNSGHQNIDHWAGSQSVKESNCRCSKPSQAGGNGITNHLPHRAALGTKKVMQPGVWLTGQCPGEQVGNSASRPGYVSGLGSQTSVWWEQWGKL